MPYHINLHHCEIAHAFLNTYFKNFIWYRNLASAKRILKAARNHGFIFNTQHTIAFATRKFMNRPIGFQTLAAVSIISELPIGVWLASDLQTAYQRGFIILNKNKTSFSINSSIITDGFFFYSKEIERMYPQCNPALMEFIDLKFDTRSYSLNIDTFHKNPNPQPVIIPDLTKSNSQT